MTPNIKNDNDETQHLAENDSLQTFDDILELIDSNGPFQKRFNWIFNLFYSFLLALTCMNHIIVLNTPEHWCYVPGRNLSNNVDIEIWKEMTVPFEIDANGEKKFSKCQMYKKPFVNNSENEVIECQNGWEYSKQWYETTISSQENWVCDKEMYITHSFIYSRVGEFIGTIIFGTLGDILGRRPVFFVTVIGLTLCRIAMLFTTHSYFWFMFVSAFGSFTTNAGFQSPLTIAMEISASDQRAMINAIQFFGWTIGLCVLPWIMWAVREWDVFLMITTLPGLLILIFTKWLIESPRWLLSKGHYKQSYKILKMIAKINKRSIPDNLLSQLQKISKNIEKSYGIMSLTTSWRLMKNCLLLCNSWCAVIMCYNVILYNIENLGGNPYLNFLLLAVIEFPSNLAGKIMTDRLGRRLAHLIAFSLCAVTCFILAVTLHYNNDVIVTVCFAILIKFFVSLQFCTVNLQTLEVYPTCVRQSGVSACLFLSLAASSFGPYISYLGKFDLKYPYLLIGALTVFASITGTFLPETANKRLPETLEEAKTFGADQSFWSFSNKAENTVYKKPVE